MRALTLVALVLLGPPAHSIRTVSRGNARSTSNRPAASRNRHLPVVVPRNSNTVTSESQSGRSLVSQVLRDALSFVLRVLKKLLGVVFGFFVSLYNFLAEAITNNPIKSILVLVGGVVLFVLWMLNVITLEKCIQALEWTGVTSVRGVINDALVYV